ncbi:MAG: hypothetical protein RMJ51_02335 [Candidatus Calescibacterium sp.]|nr:hypothetical protein [Candidatus Calescibacterium sp.]MCX7972332.1 hypothetical protein [bacterium]MDW8195064.1 hypothetical protein [Candidatus Calescibacterium sp.]
MNCTDKLIDSKPFDYDYYDDKLFEASMTESFLLQYQKSKFYREYIKFKGLNNPESISDLWDQRLFISVFVLKEFIGEADFQITNDIQVEIFSSGTSNKPSRMVLDKVTLERIRKIVFKIYGDYGLVDLSSKYNYLFFTYEDLSLGTAFSDVLLSELAPKINKKFFVLKKKGSSFFFDLEGTIQKLFEFQNDGLKLRILGFPSYIYYTIKELQRRNIKFNFDGVVLPGGGWKTHKQEISVQEFRELVYEYLGIREIRDLYGMVEHGIPYVECEYHNKHIPRYSRVRTFNPLKREFNNYDEVGLLSFMTPYATSYTIAFVISSDVGYISFGCKCGRKAPYVVLLGRAGKVKLRGCAISALEFLKNFSN